MTKRPQNADATPGLGGPGTDDGRAIDRRGFLRRLGSPVGWDEIMAGTDPRDFRAYRWGIEP